MAAPGVADTAGEATGEPGGDAADVGLGRSVAMRSAASWVRTAGATLMTASLGGEADWVSTRARRRLANSAPAATIAFVRFKRVLAVRARPATGGDDEIAGAVASCARSYTCSGPFYAQNWRICSDASISLLDIPHRFSMLARNCLARTYKRSF